MKVFLINTLCVFAFITINAQNKIQYNLNVDDTFKVEQKATQDIVQDMNGSKHEMKNVIEGDFTFVVKEVTEAGYLIDFNFDRFKMTTTSNLYGTIMNVDTSEEAAEENVEAKIFSGLIGNTMQMTMLKNGRIESITGTEALVKKMVEGSGVEDDFTKQLMIEAMKKEFGNESLSNSFEQMTYIYPETEVVVGDTWANEYSGDLKAQNIWTLVEINDATLNLTGKSDIQMLTIEEEVTMTLNGTQSTAIIAGIKNGFVKTMKVSSDANGTTMMKQMSDIEIPTTITTITEYKIQ